jgi:hypothetical protein
VIVRPPRPADAVAVAALIDAYGLALGAAPDSSAADLLDEWRARSPG